MTGEQPDPFEQARALHQRGMEIELELRQARVRWASILCSCLDGHPAACQVHGMFLILPDGRVV